MFKDSVKGLQSLFDTDDRERPANILLSGSAGSMKTTFSYALITTYLKNHPDEHGLYVSFEEDVKKQQKKMKKLGIILPKNLHLINVADLRHKSRYEELGADLSTKQVEEMEMADYEDFIKHYKEGEKDYEQLLENALEFMRKKYGDKFSIFVLDSLGAFYSVMKKSNTNLRARMHHFFAGLRSKNLYSFIIAERGRKAETHLLGHEGYLVDGILEFGTVTPPGKDKKTRFVEIEKMRGCRHSRERHEFDVEKGKGMTVYGPIFMEDAD